MAIHIVQSKQNARVKELRAPAPPSTPLSRRPVMVALEGHYTFSSEALSSNVECNYRIHSHRQ